MLKNKILCWYGKDPFEAGQILMESSGIWENWSFSDHIGLKPNLVVSKKASSGATTLPEFCAGIITFLQKKGFHNISILEGSWVGDRTEMKKCSIGIGLPITEKPSHTTRHTDLNIVRPSVRP